MPFWLRGDNWAVLRILAALGLTAVLVTGCGNVFVAPSPTAGDFTDVVGALVRRGMTVTTQVSGDSGCRSRTAALVGRWQRA